MLLVDDQEIIRMGFRMVLGAVEGIEVVGEASGGDEVLDMLAEHPADVVLIDVRMPRIDDIKATRRAMTLEDPPHVLVLTTFDPGEYTREVLHAGASDFLLKDAPLEKVAAAIRHVHDDDTVVALLTTRRLLSRFTAPKASSLTAPTSTAPLELLAPHEREMLSLVTRELSSREIVDELVLSEGAIKAHVGHVLTKLDLRDRIQAVVLAYGAGLIAPGSA